MPGRKLIKLFVVIIIILLLTAGGALIIFRSKSVWNKQVESALKSTECKTVTGPRYGKNYYNGPLIDTHYHIPDLTLPIIGDFGALDQVSPSLGLNLTISDIVCTLNQENTTKVFAFFPVYPEISDYHIELAKRTMQKYPDKFVPFIMPPEHDNSPNGFPTVDAKTLSKMLSVYPGLFRGFGEIGLYERQGGAPALPPNSPRLTEIYPVVQSNKLVVYFHLGENQKESFEKVLDQNPDINFIWHGDQLIPGEQDGMQDLSNIEDIIRNHPNAFYTIDELYGNKWMIKPEVKKEEFLNYLEDYENLLQYDLNNWKWIIEKYPNQFMWGTDRSDQVLWSHDLEVGQALSNYARAFIAGLNTNVQENFAYKNAERLLQ